MSYGLYQETLLESGRHILYFNNYWSLCWMGNFIWTCKFWAPTFPLEVVSELRIMQFNRPWSSENRSHRGLGLSLNNNRLPQLNYAKSFLHGLLSKNYSPLMAIFSARKQRRWRLRQWIRRLLFPKSKTHRVQPKALILVGIKSGNFVAKFWKKKWKTTSLELENLFTVT